MYQAPEASAAPAAPAAPRKPPPRGSESPPRGSESPPRGSDAPRGAPAPPPGSDAPRGAPAPTGDAEALVQAHNQVRAKHCAAPLTWSPRLAQIAKQWANTLRDKGCQFGHSGGSTGENLAAGTSGTLDAAAVVKMWSDEAALYKFPDGGFSMKTGHFTQVVWRGTTQVGCGRSQCKGMDIWVCEYDPPGNWEGQYRENVLPTTCSR
jgi:uncharacterized protein YkwD